MANIGAEPPPARPVPLRVVAAVIRRDDGAILLSLRAAHADQGGLWEFPGGKLEAGERDIDGLARELREELGITIRRARPLISVLHAYPQREVALTVLDVDSWRGEPHGREGQAIRWVRPDELGTLDFPAANLPVTTAARLPRVLLRTGALGDRSELLRLEAWLAAGVRLVCLRLAAGDTATRRALARAAVRVGRAHGATMLLDGSPDEALDCAAHGLHLDTTRLRGTAVHPLPAGLLLSACCANVADLRLAEGLGVDFVHLTGALATPPDIDAAGWRGAKALLAVTRLPAYAVGELKPAHARPALRAGCQGIVLEDGNAALSAPREVLAAVAQAVRAAAYVTRRGG